MNWDIHIFIVMCALLRYSCASKVEDSCTVTVLYKFHFIFKTFFFQFAAYVLYSKRSSSLYISSSTFFLFANFYSIFLIKVHVVWRKKALSLRIIIFLSLKSVFHSFKRKSLWKLSSSCQ